MLCVWWMNATMTTKGDRLDERCTRARVVSVVCKSVASTDIISSTVILRTFAIHLLSLTSRKICHWTQILQAQDPSHISHHCPRRTNVCRQRLQQNQGWAQAPRGGPRHGLSRPMLLRYYAKSWIFLTEHQSWAGTDRKGEKVSSLRNEWWAWTGLSEEV